MYMSGHYKKAIFGPVVYKCFVKTNVGNVGPTNMWYFFQYGQRADLIPLS